MATTTTPRSRAKATPAKADTKADAALSEVKDEKTGKRLTIQQLKNKLRNEAEREVLDTHKDEVITITQAKYDAHGLEYVRRLSDEEKAAKQIEELYEKFPHLRPQLEQQHQQQQTSLVMAGGWYAPAEPQTDDGLTESEREADRNAAESRDEAVVDQLIDQGLVEADADAHGYVEDDGE